MILRFKKQLLHIQPCSNINKSSNLTVYLVPHWSYSAHSNSCPRLSQRSMVAQMVEGNRAEKTKLSTWCLVSRNCP